MKEMKRILSLVLCFVMLVGLMPNLAFAAEGDPVVVIAGSDYQQSGMGKPADNARNILTRIEQDYTKESGVVKGFLFGGDYSQTINNSSSTTSGINELKGVVQGVYGTGLSEVYVQGNHDAAVSELTSTDAHDTDYYGVFTINEDAFPSGGSVNSTMLTKLENYLNGKVNEGYKKPIFVVTHLPLHVTTRGDNTGANKIFTLLNEAGASGLNIIFLFGHNHSGGYDAYLGNGSIYLPKGSDITVAGGSTTTLNFTYANYGYVGYVGGSGGCKHLTMTTFEIYQDEVIVKRYDEDGLHTCGTTANVLKAAGGGTVPSGASLNSTVYTSSQSITLTTPTGGSGDSGNDSTEPETPTTPDAPPTVDTDNKSWITISDGVGKIIYKLDTDGVDAGSKYLIVSDDEAVAMSAAANSSNSVSIELNSDETEAYPSSTDYEWTIDTSGDGYKIYNADGEYIGRSSGNISNDNTDVWTITGNNEGAYTVRTGNYVLRYSGSNSAFRVGSSYTYSYAVRLYKYLRTESATAEYAKLSDNLTATVARGADRAAAEAAIKAAVDVLVAHNADYSDAGAILDSDENIIWTLASNYDGNVPGEYAVTISYKGVELGTAKVIVPDTAILCDDVVYYLEGQGPWTTSIGATVTEGTTLEGQYTYEILEGGDAIIDSIAEDGTIHFSGTEGTAQVKITYTYADGDTTATLEKIINVTASEPHFTLNLHAQAKDENGNPVAGAEITAPVPVKGVEEGDTYSLWAVIKKFDAENPDGADIGDVADNMIKWESSDTSIATVDPATGVVTFTGKDGTVTITATYQDGNHPYDAVVLSATKEQYNVPADGTTDFPEYPNEGAVRFDKTATAVGNFSETGIAQVELSMTGVPYTTGSEIDVVLMLDRSRSMSSARINATVAATEAFIKGIVKNEDDSYNGNRIYVGYFMGAATYDITDADNIGGTFTTVDNDDELEELIKNLKAEYTQQSSNGGTDWQIALEDSEKLLDAAKRDGIGNNRPQFCVFMSDGAPSDYVGLDGTSYNHTTTTGSGYSSAWVTGGERNSDYEYETYSTRMKGTKGITIYSVMLGETGTQPQFLMNDLSGAAGETKNDTGSAMSKLDKYYYNVPDTNAAANMENVFKGIAVSILQAATDIVVEDQITKEYTMIFDVPQGDKDIDVTNDFYIEFLKYTLDEDHERTDDVVSVTKMYLKKTDGIYSAASDSTGAAYAAPVFAQNVIGEKGTMFYWTTDSSYAAKAAVSYSDGTNTYYFIPYGMEKNEDGTAPANWYNMISGGYANGTVDAVTNMSENLVIATPYFVYNASTKMLYWTVDKLDTAEYALRYFLYLDDSATEVGTSKETAPGSYPTNDHAYITYTNFKGNDCRQEFPKPQLTWSGAQVSYVFYLVNAQGQPINKSGQVVDFANATFVTDIYTEDTVWNKGEDGKVTADSKLGIDWLAKELLPSDYKVYDEEAQYQLHVYGNHDGTSNFDYFTIGGADAAAISSSLNSRLEGMNTTASTVSLTTTKVYNTKAGTKITGYGTYASEEADGVDEVLSGFDFYNTTVAFAVVWQPALAPDTIVVDYGLDVLINVTFNDLMQDNTISGIGLGRDAYGNIVENTGISTDKVLGTAPLTTDDGSTISIEPVTEGEPTQIRFSQNDMTFNAPVTFYYESKVEYYEASEEKTGYLHTSVTVIPATTIYYEDEYVELTTHTRQEDGSYVKTEGWTVNSTDATATQAQDRPGTTQITGVIDANNNYGYDAAYESMSTYSMSNAAKITVSDGIEGQANFDFYGTGFDVISLTDTTTGTITVRVYEYNEDGSLASKPLHSYVVDTYYGYMLNENGKWVTTDSNDPNALYQVPVMKISGLEYGKYRARIVVFYDEFFDNKSDGSYDFYLDAVRIYDPTGNRNDVANDAYVKDGEGWPTYEEVRNYVIGANTFESVATDPVNGIVFIDGIGNTATVSDYSSYGPNNELYLAPGQAIAFELNATAAAGEVAKVQMALKTVTGNASVKVYATDGTTALDTDIATATDMYYDITSMNGKTVVIMNDGDSGVLSITNVKVTYTEAQPEASDPAPAMFLLRRSSVDDALATLNVEEEVPETTVPETTVPEETEPETTVPETTVPEETEPETTEPETTEPEETEPEETKPSQQEQAEQVIRKVVKIIKGFLGWIFG